MTQGDEQVEQVLHHIPLSAFQALQPAIETSGITFAPRFAYQIQYVQLSLRYWRSQQLCVVDCNEKLGMVLVPESSIWMLHWPCSRPLSNSMINLSILACCVLGPYPGALVQFIQWHLQLPSIHHLFSKVHFSLHFSMLSHCLSAPQLHICQEFITVDPPPTWMFHGFYWVSGLSFPLLTCGSLPRIHKQKNILYTKPGYQTTKQQRCSNFLFWKQCHW